MKNRIIYIAAFLAGLTACPLASAKMPTDRAYTNSIGMKLARIPRGGFQMGQLKTPLPSQILPVFRGRGKFDLLSAGDFDEKPVHTITISTPFYMGVFEVTNFQYELFDPVHKKLRGKDGFSKEDDEAVVNVNWYDAQAFCRWLSDQERLPYRLPTEAEWEYACRAGTTSNYYAGDILPEQFRKSGAKNSLHVGKTPPNPWGLYDMHGNVEEWCNDWYGPYQAKSQLDPVGYITGHFKVLRGGSHGTPDYYLRSANRMAQLPECKNRLMGFRVALGELPPTKPLLMPQPPLNQQNVIQRNPAEVTKGPNPDVPYFRGPYKYVKIPTDAIGPLFAAHNHDPAIVECPNGDLLACWYTCVDEGARELAQAASRLPWGRVEWQSASPFWDTPDRNDHAPAMWFDGEDTIYHFTGVGANGGRGRMVMVMRSSEDSGATWSAPRAIVPDFAGGHQLSEPVFRMRDGAIVLTIDGSRTLWMSRDEGLTWANPGGSIAGIHAGVTQLKDASIFALSRSNGDKEKMPISISRDGGKTFTYKPSEFQPIGGGQRLALLRLKEGPLFFASFANLGEGMEITDSTGANRKIRGLFAAISEDEGRTWPYKRLVSDDGPGRTIECTDGGAITLSAHSAEYRGYMAVCQSTDGLIHLITSRNHYAFNLTWLRTPPPPAPAPPVRVKRVVETFTGPDFDADGWTEYKGFTDGFNGKGQYTVNAHVHYEGINRVVGEGSFEALFAVKNIHYNPPGLHISDGLTLGFKDAFNRHNPTMFIWIRENGISGNVFKHIPLSKPPTAVKLRFIWKKSTRQWRVFYGLNGAEPRTEFPESKTGLYYESPLTESTAAYFLMSNGRMDVDHFDITPDPRRSMFDARRVSSIEYPVSSTNSIGMKLVRIEPGRFAMGFGDKPLPKDLITRKSHFPYGDFDEHPTHQVKITKPFYMGAHQVTNAQYELFDPAHKKWRGQNGYSEADNEAVVFVSWHDAVRFCDWLSKKEAMPYRLPTEAEWEYACRAATTTPFYTGDTLPKEFLKSSKTPLAVGQTPPNPWGLYDMHGNVEEWCYDWYGPYEPVPQEDPVGRSNGNFKVTRGGSHSTSPYYLRSSNRSGSLPDDKQWLIGFRIVLAEMPKTQPLPTITQNYQRYVKQNVPPDLTKGPDPDKPYFNGPRPFVKIPKDATGPLYGRHNHFPAVVECPNGDLLAAWFTCIEERGRELGIAASRLRYGRQQWEPASLFWDGPDRNDHTTAFFNDGRGTIYHFNGLGVSNRGLAIILRKSKDNGVTWSDPRLIFPDRDARRNVVESVFRTTDGQILLPGDGRGGTIIALSPDEGQTWTDPGGNIRGIHAGVAQLNDGRLLAFGRRHPIDGKMPMSISTNMGSSWQYFPSEFQPLNLGQRVALTRLKQGPLLFASFCKKMVVTDASGKQRPISGLFAALSTNEGKTWPYKRLVSDDGTTRDISTMDDHPVTMDAHYSEFVGYLSVCQTPDRVIHLLSSHNHYAFNLKWLTTPPPAASPSSAPMAQHLPIKHSLTKIYKPKRLPSQDDWGWIFRGSGESDVATFASDSILKISTTADQQCWWRSDTARGYGAVDQSKGFTAEIRTKILKTTPGHRGIDFELYDGAGSRYAITITDTGLYWYEGLVYGSVFLEFEQFTPVAEGLDNTDAMHTYRLAVRDDRVVQIYRDKKLIGLRRYEYRTPRDAYILFGAGHGVEALVDYIAYDLNGPCQP